MDVSIGSESYFCLSVMRLNAKIWHVVKRERGASLYHPADCDRTASIGQTLAYASSFSLLCIPRSLIRTVEWHFPSRLAEDRRRSILPVSKTGKLHCLAWRGKGFLRARFTFGEVTKSASTEAKTRLIRQGRPWQLHFAMQEEVIASTLEQRDHVIIASEAATETVDDEENSKN